MSKHNDRKQLEGMLSQFRSPLDLRAKPGPPQHPVAAAIDNLRRIAQKAARGLSKAELKAMPTYPQGFVSPFGFYPTEGGRRG